MTRKEFPIGDFSAGFRVIWISLLAVGVGAACAFVAFGLQRLIGLFTNLFYYGTLAFDISKSPADNGLGLAAICVPVLGGLIIGLMARFGSERIRGHGIPEAMEAILIGQSRIQPKVAVLKPLSSAISIGSGGPFGAEGPIIMTGGAFGSIVAQMFHMTAAERKTLLVAGAAGGMSATFATPLAAVLLAVELLLFEWKPRSLIPVGIASVVAALLRPCLLGEGPLFPAPMHTHNLETAALLAATGVGLCAGALSMALTVAVYAAEDAFQRLPVHWMWWPALGGLIIGIGGYFQPHALGIGTDIIEGLLQGRLAVSMLLILMIVKFAIWSISLGSGTSGGVLAPLLMMGGALGALESSFLPGHDKALWALVSMAATLGGVMRSPLTGVVFALELTHDVKVLPALLIASLTADAFSVLMMKRSILTEKVARRGYHVSREYSVDPLERIQVEHVMSTKVVAIPAALPVNEVLPRYFFHPTGPKHQGYPIIDEKGAVLGFVTKTNLLQDWVRTALRGEKGPADAPIVAFDLIHRPPITVYAWESCRTAAERMAEMGVGRLAVVDSEESRRLVGLVTRSDLLKARARSVEEELKRARLLGA